MSAGESWSWMAVALGMTTGCLGDPNALPPPLESSSGGTAMDTSTTRGSADDAADTTSGVGITDESSTTGPAAECGNGKVEDGEECDEMDWNGATCESLGHVPGSLACTGSCVFDVTGCTPPGMVLVPGGMFEMGSNVYADEQPIRQVQVDAFYIDETEVTVAAYEACVGARGCTEPSMDPSCNWMVNGREDHPVNCVTWPQAEEYCAWVDGGANRLPTEAEWEKAARGTDARTYPWGNSPTPSCVYAVMDEGMPGCGMDGTWPVGSKPDGDSPYGVHDMAGNVWEWVADWYATSYDAAETDNPTGPAMGTQRVRRGGSWYTNSDYLHAANRGFPEPGEPDPIEYVGFRCARTPPT